MQEKKVYEIKATKKIIAKFNLVKILMNENAELNRFHYYVIVR